MVVKTELCAISEYRIYPGHGIRFIRRDGQPVVLSSSKCKSMMQQRKKPAKLMWTQAWRRLNKKGKDEGVAKKKARKIIKAQRAIVGATLEDLKKKRVVAKPKSAATEAALKEIKEQKKAGKKAASTGPRATGAAVPKVQRSAAASSRGSSGR